MSSLGRLYTAGATATNADLLALLIDCNGGKPVVFLPLEELATGCRFRYADRLRDEIELVESCIDSLEYLAAKAQEHPHKFEGQLDVLTNDLNRHWVRLIELTTRLAAVEGGYVP